VKDACVLIDLANGGLLEAWFQLGVETFTTDLVIRQIKAEDQWQQVSEFIESSLLKVQTLTGEQMSQIYSDRSSHSLGIEDMSVLHLAVQQGAILITGDRRLRHQALERSVEVRGVLWILDVLVERAVMIPARAAAQLQVMINKGARLPKDECEKRFSDWT